MISNKKQSLRPSDALNKLYPPSDLSTSLGYFKGVTIGVSGEQLESFVQRLGDYGLFARIVDVQVARLSEVFAQKRLPRPLSDSILDTIRLYMMAADIFESIELAKEWLQTSNPALGGEVPSQLMDSHAGRELIRQVLKKIEYGEHT